MLEMFAQPRRVYLQTSQASQAELSSHVSCSVVMFDITLCPTPTTGRMDQEGLALFIYYYITGLVA